MAASSTTKTPISIVGATGYIGGAVLSRLIQHSNAESFQISAIIRNSDKAQILQSKFGVSAVVGTFQDLDKIESLAESAHIVFNIADADDVGLTTAILNGLRKRHAASGDLPILIHTSGTGVITDDARGMHPTDTIFNDNDVEQIKSIPDTAFHRNVDLLIMNADKEGYVRSHIIAPSTIYGVAKGPLVDAGVSNDRSIQIPVLVRASLSRKQAGMVGLGKALWPDVQIDEVADLYIILLDSIIGKPGTTGHGWEGFYFGENGEHSWFQISRAIGEAMVALGLATDPEPTTFSTEELIAYFGSEAAGLYSGTNARCKADRGRALGWKPTHTTKDMLESIRGEVEHYAQLLKEGKLEMKFEPAAGKHK